jgi:Fic family protein
MIKSSAVYSSNIEGVSVDINSFNQDPKLFDRHTQKEIAEVQDLVDAYEHAKSQKLNEKNLLSVHKLLSRHLVTKSRQGSYRSERIGVFIKEGLVYLGIEEILVAHEMSELFNVIRELLSQKLTTIEVIFWDSWLHLEIAMIHPFLDGNGRAARLLEKWFMTESLGEHAWILQTEEFYFKNRAVYYRNLKLGAHYWKVSFKKSKVFLEMLAKYLNS